MTNCLARSTGMAAMRRNAKKENRRASFYFPLEEDCDTHRLVALALASPYLISMLAALTQFLGDRPSFYYPPEQVLTMKERFHLETPELLRLMVQVIRQFAVVPISNFRVGAAALGSSGAIYCGVNMEWTRVAFAQTVHAEQCCLTNAWHHREPRILMLAASEPPCGHCRQFMNELCGCENLQVISKDSAPMPLHDLLPKDFGPAALEMRGIDATWQGPALRPVGSPKVPADLLQAALEAAQRAHVPYGTGPSGSRSTPLRHLLGCPLENAAYNPTFSPLQVALVRMHCDHKPWTASPRRPASCLVSSPQAPYHVVSIERVPSN
ncbi:putative cytidine deaminase [Paratrimastix pyriformis]|uniref:Cytidine deaminase n=1 Tax=Paratrimastix pyriformis TaxID=342808 RepID=A0ABQ8UWF9_9EUKA|nr:putative cytidine deaminase [Paratrimastix pyriformis]